MLQFVHDFGCVQRPINPTHDDVVAAAAKQDLAGCMAEQEKSYDHTFLNVFRYRPLYFQCCVIVNSKYLLLPQRQFPLNMDLPFPVILMALLWRIFDVVTSAAARSETMVQRQGALTSRTHVKQ